MKKLFGSLCLAVACIAATTCKAEDRRTLAAEAPYWLMACEPEFKATPGLAESVYGFTLGMLTGLVETDKLDAVKSFVEATTQMAEEGIRDRDAAKFNRVECARLVASFAAEWDRLP